VYSQTVEVTLYLTGMILSFCSSFTIRKLAYIALERLKNLEISLGKLRIFLLQLRICPKIMA
jgi:hypothetical protein